MTPLGIVCSNPLTSQFSPAWSENSLEWGNEKQLHKVKGRRVDIRVWGPNHTHRFPGEERQVFRFGVVHNLKCRQR